MIHEITAKYTYNNLQNDLLSVQYCPCLSHQLPLPR